MIYAGIDIAKNDHVVGATDERGRNASRPMKFANSAEGFDRCIAYVIYAVLSKQEPYDPRVTKNPELASRSE